jgi:hypothetical protein
MRLVRPTMLVLAAVLVMQPSAASADRLRQGDPVGDVARSPIGSNVYTIIPTQVQGDIVATRVVHAPRAVWVRVSLRELTTTSNGNFHVIAVKSDRRYRMIRLDAFPDHWEGRTVTTGKRGSVVPCGVRHHIDYDRNRVTLKIPRACLGKPDWVRVGVRTTVAGATYAFADDAHATGIGPALVYGKRIRH